MNSGDFLRMWMWSGTALVPCDSVPLSDRGFRFGMSIFESLRVADGQVQYLDAHLARLRTACGAREFSIDPQALAQAGELLSGCGGNGFARVYVTAGDGTATSAAAHSRVFVFLEERARPTQLAYDLAISEEVCHPLFGGVKTANYWQNLDLLQQAERGGKHEALLFNESAELISACVANVFVVHGSRIRTPALFSGARAGVIREKVMQRLPVQECSLFIDDLRTADEVFLTNSWIGVMPVASIQDRVLSSRAIAESVCGGL